ncbi:MAG: fibronectin type III domain-containing protein, partial [Thermoplasmata archaeon]|nr:fibronectin type III domain-containing protein [Thermoplasmata archaeon]
MPVLRDPGDISFDGNYQVSWNQTLRCTGYILEESLTPTFNSPTLIYNGPNNTFNFQNKENNIYYYRAKGYNELDESIWSNIVDIIVDTPPNAPLGLVAEDPTGHEITLSWDQNSDPDLEGYHIFMNNTGASATGPFHWIHTALKTETQHIVTNLFEETIYYFVLLAFDTHLINSTFSNVASALTLDVTAPNAPTGVMATVKSNNNIQLTWEANTEQDLMGYIIYINDTGSVAAGTFHEINATTGLETRYTVTGRAEQTTYYFKIKAFDEVPNQSPFSNVTYATTLDHTPPSAPTGLQIINHTEDSLTIVWNASPDSDVIGYYIYRGESLSELFVELNSEPTEMTQYIDTGLEEATTYYYRVIAIDEVPHESEPSEIVSGRTLYAQHKPEINVSMRNFKIPEDSVDMSINLYVWFSDVNNDPLEFRVDGDDYIIVTIHQENGTVILEPEHDWNGKETLTFYAKDDVGEVSDSVIVTVTGVNDPPSPAKIISVDDNLVINDGESIDLEAVCDDPDLIYGDKLTYTWSSDLTGLIGKGKVREGVVLSAGHHLIT